MSFQDLYGGGGGAVGMPFPQGTPANAGGFSQNPSFSLENLLRMGRTAVGSLLPATGLNASPAPTPSPASQGIVAPAPLPPAAAPSPVPMGGPAPSALPMQQAFTPPLPQPRPNPPPTSLAPPNPGAPTPVPMGGPALPGGMSPASMNAGAGQTSAPGGQMNPGMLQNFLQMLRQGQPQQGGATQAPHNGMQMGQAGQPGLLPRMIGDIGSIAKMFGPGASGAGGGFTGGLSGLW